MFAGHLKAKPVEESDALAAMRVIPVNHADYDTIITIAALDKWIAAAIDQGFVCIDTETDSLDSMQANLIGMSFSVQEQHAWYIPLQHDYPGAPEQLPLQEVLAKLKPMLQNPQIKKCAQNGKYDLHVLNRYQISVQGLSQDTMLQSFVLNAGRARHDMDSMSENYLGYTPVSITELIGKKGANQGTMRDVPIEQVKEYAAEDADVTLQLYNVFKKEIDHTHLHKLFYEVETPLIPVLTDMEYEGVKVDTDFLKQ